MFLTCCLLAVAAHAQPTDVRPTWSLVGAVLDVRTGEPIAKARVWVRELGVETVSGATGEFTLAGLPQGRFELTVSTVGFGVVKQAVEVPGPARVTVLLGQEAIRRSDEVSVTAGAFETQERGAVAEHTLDNTELRNLSSVVADDPLRSVQTLPGAVTGDDFNGTFSVRGSGFETVGLYIDGVLIASPFHTIRDVNDGYSLTILNGDVVEGISLVSSAPPARFGDRVGAALSVETRDGSRERRFTRAHLGAAGVSLWSEGPIGKDSSWLVGMRKSFLDYVINRIEEDPTFVVGYYDVQAKLSRRKGPHQWSLFLLHGHSVWQDQEPGQTRGSVVRADAGTQIANARWRFTPSERGTLLWSAFVTRETGDNTNNLGESLFRSGGRQAGLRGDWVRKAARPHTLEAGLSARRITEAAFERFVAPGGPALRTFFDYGRGHWHPAVYAQDTWTPRRGRLALTLGGRWDRSGVTGEGLLLPRGSLTYSFTPHSKLSAAAGGYAQFPTLARLFGDGGNPGLRAQRSRQYTVAWEHRLGERLRFRAEVYHHEESRLLHVPHSEFRRSAGAIVFPRVDAAYQNSVSGRSRGFELLLQRRSANGLSGWVSYAYGHADREDSVTREAFASDFDQRHTFNTYASLRLSDRLNLSAKYRYGSNVPVPGFYAEAQDGFTLAEDRNLVRLPPYSRLDVRANRAFFFKRAKLTVYAEVSNVLDRTHYRYSDVGINTRTGRVVFDRDTLFPLLPAAGVTVEF